MGKKREWDWWLFKGEDGFKGWLGLILMFLVAVLVAILPGSFILWLVFTLFPIG